MNKEIYWCIRPSIESESYGDVDVVKPWKGVKTSQNRLSRINDDGDIDTDINTISIIEDDDLWVTPRGARESFFRARHLEIQNLLELISEKLKEIQ